MEHRSNRESSLLARAINRLGRRRKPHFDPIDELAISGEEAELVDVVDGRRFLYHFEQEGRLLEDVVRQGIATFKARYQQLPTVIILSDSYQLYNGQLIGGLEAMVVQGLPSYHFWFGPKPAYYQPYLGL
jgi:hypothetical protein